MSVVIGGRSRAEKERRLPVQVEFGCRQGGRAVFEFGKVGMKVVVAALGSECRKVFHLEITGFFQVVVVGYKVRAFLSGRRRGREAKPEAHGAQHQQRSTPKQSQNRSP